MNKLNIANIKIGDKVHYQPEHYSDSEWENGMVKEVPDFATDPSSSHYDSIRVVYNCAGEWENFKNYTSALTNLSDLKPGWKH